MEYHPVLLEQIAHDKMEVLFDDITKIESFSEYIEDIYKFCVMYDISSLRKIKDVFKYFFPYICIGVRCTDVEPAKEFIVLYVKNEKLIVERRFTCDLQINIDEFICQCNKNSYKDNIYVFQRRYS